MRIDREQSFRRRTRFQRVVAALVLAFLILAQPLQALRLSCADVARLFPEHCCCRAVEESCCSAGTDDEVPSQPRVEPRFDCECAIELPSTPPSRHSPEPRADVPARVFLLVADDWASDAVAEAWRSCSLRAPDRVSRAGPPRSACFARLPCRAAGTIAELSVLCVARC